MSEAIRAVCGPNQTAYSATASDGAALHLILTESERLFDSCPQRYDTGANPYVPVLPIFVVDSAPSSLTAVTSLVVIATTTTLLTLSGGRLLY
jgi:hypothetical protein